MGTNLQEAGREQASPVDWIDELRGLEQPEQNGNLACAIGGRLPDARASQNFTDPFPRIPAELKSLRRWVVWRAEERDGKRTKVPVAPLTGKRADSTDPASWTQFEVAVDHKRTFDGIGCVIAPPYVGIDLDKCRNKETGEIEPWARAVIVKLDSYTEVSPSGQGFHIWVKSTLPAGRRRAGRVELYDRARYFTVTGQPLDWVSQNVEERDLASFHTELLRLDPEYRKQGASPRPPGTEHSEPNYSKFGILMAGRWQEAGYQSQSEADEALCVILAFKYNRDVSKIDAEFRRSGLYREKWERQDYRGRTIKRATELVAEKRRSERGRNHIGERIATLATECFADIEAKPTAWLWKDRIPKGKLTIFSGNPDVGKTTVVIDVIARYTTGSDWPDGTKNEVAPGEVLMFVAEDDAGDTLKPRLQAAAADQHRIHSVTGVIQRDSTKHEKTIALDKDLALLREALRLNARIGLVVIDPITSYLGKADLNKEQELRRVLGPLKLLCEETGVTILGLGHFNKRGDVAAIHKTGGAVAMTGVPRAVWYFFKNPEVNGEYLMLLGKGNLTRKRTGLRYRINEKVLPTGGTPIIAWEGGDVESDADTILEIASDPSEKRRVKAARFLSEFLAQGGRPSEEVLATGQARGLSRSALFEGKRDLGIVARKKAGCWYWSLEEDGAKHSKNTVA